MAEPFEIYNHVPPHLARQDKAVPFFLNPRIIPGITLDGDTFKAGSVNVAEVVQDGYRFYREDGSLDATVVPVPHPVHVPPAEFSVATGLSGWENDLDVAEPGIRASGSIDFTGFVAPAAGVKKRITIFNIGTSEMGFWHDRTSSSANRLYNPGGARIMVKQYGQISYEYDHSLSKWIVSSAIISERE